MVMILGLMILHEFNILLYHISNKLYGFKFCQFKLYKRNIICAKGHEGIVSKY